MVATYTERTSARAAVARLVSSLAAALCQPIALVLVAFLGLGLAYLYCTPPFESPDEYGHYAYVRYLAEQRRLPPLLISDNDWVQGQMHQAPLYYLLGAMLAGRLDTPEWQAVYPRNPRARLGDPTALVHRNAVIHPGLPHPAAKRTVAALRLLRLYSLTCAAIGVWLAYGLARQVAPQARWLATGAAAALAFTPQYLFIGSSVNNDSLVAALAPAVLLLSVQVASSGGHRYRTPLLIGALVGLAGLAKLSGLASVTLPVVACLLHGLGRHGHDLWRDRVRPVLIVLLSSSLVVGPWVARNAWLYGDPLAVRSITHVFSIRQQPLSISEALRVLWEAVPSYWGVFGWFNVLAPPWFYRAVYCLTVAAAVGLAVRATQLARRRTILEPASVRALVVTWLWALVLVGLMVRWTQIVVGAQGRHAFPAGGVLSLMLIAGVTGLVPTRWRPRLAALVCGALFLAAAYMPWRVIAPAYDLRVRIPRNNLPESVRPIHVRYGDALTLIAAEVVSSEAQAGDYVWVRMYWETERPPSRPHTVAVQLVGAQGERLGGLDTWHAMGRYPSNLWQPGQVTVDNAIVPVEHRSTDPVAVAIRVAVYEERPDAPLPAYDGQGRLLASAPVVGFVRMVPETLTVETPQQPLEADYGGLTLHGYDLSWSQPLAGAVAMTVTLHWACQAPVSEAYTVFVHLVDAQGRMVAQADSPPLHGSFGTPFWRAGDRVRDPHVLYVPADRTGEPLFLRVGLYLLETGQRRALVGNPQQDAVEIGPILLAHQSPMP